MKTAEDLIESIYNKITDDLLSSRLSNCQTEDGDSYPLVDQLSTGKDISTGRIEIINLVDQIEIDDLLKDFASQSQGNKDLIIEGLKELQEFNPYPESVFIPISDDDMKQFVEYITKYGYSSDALFGNWGRQVWNNCVEKAKEIFESELER